MAPARLHELAAQEHPFPLHRRDVAVPTAAPHPSVAAGATVVVLHSLAVVPKAVVELQAVVAEARVVAVRPGAVVEPTAVRDRYHAAAAAAAAAAAVARAAGLHHTSLMPIPAYQLS